MKKYFLAGITAVLLLLLVSAISEVKASSSGGTIELIGKEWNHDPLKVYIKAPSDLVPHILTALNDWSKALESASGNTVDNSEIGGSADNVFDFVIVNSSKEADIIVSVEKGAAAGILGMALIQDKDRDGYIDKVKIKVKAGLRFDLADFRNVVRHETGHALGLGHEITEKTDLMDPTYDVSAVGYDIYPSTLNINALLSIYSKDGFSLPNLPPKEIPPSYSE
ncbi:MAG: matrixin family metalloprotease [Archaeoglobaceae archaeon]|nr:matrixin family metalloprotease [Archaeoglobaceae archaeon]MCX8152252.1 matrixin family metalloprotease [Archaeoglobaceae archaeon]MDW8013930.1 matrixin family metalloprotease [Archaeoglobaceae archaeon]